jgi:signal transduction histidine kinase
MKNKILVVDDEPGLRDMFSFALGKEGYEVLTASNGEEGIKKVTEKEGIDIVITDIMMPGMNGIAVLGKIKEINPEIEVIVATGFGSMETAIECLRNGAYDYITKPININEILILLKKALETKELKSQLVSMKKLDKLKDELLSMITHELRTPLTSVMGAVKLLMGNFIPDAEKEELLAIVDKNAQKIRILIDAILDYSKMEAGFWKLNKQDVSAMEIINSSIKQIKPLAEIEKIGIIQHQSLSGQKYSSENTIVNCDPEQIGRVLINFLSNSLKYTQENGKIAVWHDITDEGIKFVVEDNGKGISKENIGRVFDKFYRVDNSVGRKEYGLGLGLAICKKIIELHGGKILAESEGEWKGSKFIFIIPASK